MLTLNQKQAIREIQTFDVIEATPVPLVEQATPQLTTQIERKSNSVEKIAPNVSAKKVFGISSQALTTAPESSDASGVNIQRGNTLETEAPKKNEPIESSVAALPIPVAEFKVSKMPVALKALNVAYPPKAFDQNIQGSVVMELLIDETGLVRDVRLIKSPDDSLSEAAIKGVKLLKFKPAMIDEKPVAVRSRYTHTFVLEKS